eukprot:a676588_96.p2 GENE.a676588_96~~a676588_96.p2  ORF type:complete len:214 (+),score=53.31 a676588_96:66-644(+)
MASLKRKAPEAAASSRPLKKPKTEDEDSGTRGMGAAESGPAFWMMKSEPECFSIDELAAKTETVWDGVRNHQAKNFLKSMRVGDTAFFYHSSVDPPGVVGLMTIVESMVPDPTQFDSKSKYYDAKATAESPRWHTVRVRFECKYSKMLTLAELKAAFTDDELTVVKKGNRLSVMPVSASAGVKLMGILDARR